MVLLRAAIKKIDTTPFPPLLCPGQIPRAPGQGGRYGKSEGSAVRTLPRAGQNGGNRGGEIVPFGEKEPRAAGAERRSLCAKHKIFPLIIVENDTYSPRSEIPPRVEISCFSAVCAPSHSERGVFSSRLSISLIVSIIKINWTVG